MNNIDTAVGITYLFDKYIDRICKKKNIDWEEFKRLNSQYNILAYIEENKDIFNEYSYADGMKLIEENLLQR